MHMKKIVKIATRQSDLALWQARHVAAMLERRHPGLIVEMLPLVTRGDRILDRPLASIGGKGLFLKELEVALLNGKADLAVHSMKDVPVLATPGLLIDVVLERANPLDALLSTSGVKLADLPAGARVGTGSLRRQAQLLALRPDLLAVDLRGNVNTRVRKLQEGQYEAIILACAGLERLGLGHLVTETLAPPGFLPAVTQGVICLQYREDDQLLRNLVRPLNHAITALCADTERAVSLQLQGSCQLPLAVYARVREDQLILDALVGTRDGRRMLRCHQEGDLAGAGLMAAAAAAELLAQGAGEIMAALSHAS
jgi:hydroxymethylbilane synthase